jgi:hypothetical protein
MIISMKSISSICSKLNAEYSRICQAEKNQKMNNLGKRNRLERELIQAVMAEQGVLVTGYG